MDKAVDKSVAEILNSEAASGWQARLTAAFFSSDAKRQAIDEIRQEVVTLAQLTNTEDMEEVQRRVIRHLIGRASRDGMPPDREAECNVEQLVGPALEDQIITLYPYPIATPYRTLTEQESATAAFGCLLDTFESLVHFLATVAVSAYLRGGLNSAECNRHLLNQLLKNTWSIGDLLALLRNTVRLAGDCDGRLPYHKLPAYLFTARGKPTASLQVLESFVTLRNRVWGHGTGRDEAVYSELIAPNRARMEQELALARWLTDWELVRPVAIDDSGRVTRADLMMGERRLKGRPYELQIAPDDLDHRGGDVRAERTLMLVTHDRQVYLPLFPLSLFHFQLHTQGVYFLQRPQWSQTEGRRQIRKAAYVAYESGIGEHEEGPGEPAARSIERQVDRLEASLSGIKVALSPMTEVSPSAEDPDYELPEVRHEQESHLHTFAGRETFLEQTGEWIEKNEGGYLLILGSPGQGKSALMAMLAHRQHERQGCLLHMIKSHRNPLKFLPSLISQAARLAQTQFGRDTYQGDMDDLRNALLIALEAVRDNVGMAVLVLDALDELEASSERLTFLPESLPPGVRVVLTCRPDIPLVQALRARLRDLEEWSLPPLSEDDLPLVLERRIGAEVLRAVESQVDWPGLFQQLQGNPLFLQRAMDRIARHATEARRTCQPLNIDQQTFPATLEALFDDIYIEISEKQSSRYTTSQGRQKARLLQFLCLAREPIGFEPLMELMAVDGMPLSLEDCRDRILEISQYLLDVGGNRFKPWHQGLLDYVQTRVLGESGCRRIEAGYCAWLQTAASRRRPYALRHRVRHLLAAQQYDELATLLGDVEFLEAKAEAGMIYDLVGDFGEAVRSLPSGHPDLGVLRLLEGALLADAYFLARHPTALFQNLWNRCWWHDCTESARHYDPPREGWALPGPPWTGDGPKVSRFMERWREQKERRTPGFVWVRALRPPKNLLGGRRFVVLRGHSASVTTVAFSPDGRRIVSGSYDKTARVFDSSIGAELLCLKGHEAKVTCVAFAHDGRRIASGSGDKTVRVWDACTGAELFCIRGYGSSVSHVAFATESRRIAGVTDEGTFWVWDEATGTKLTQLHVPHSWTRTAAFFPPYGWRIAGAWDDGTVGVRGVTNGDEGLRLRGHWGEVTSVAFSADGRRVVSTSYDRTTRVWDAETGTELLCLRGHEASPRGVAFSADGSRIASGSGDRTVRIWDTNTGAELHCLRGHVADINTVAFSPEGHSVASGSSDGTVRVWNSESGTAQHRLRGHQKEIIEVTYSPDGNRVATRSYDGTVRVWDTGTGVEQFCLRGHDAAATCAAVAPDGRLIAGGSSDGRVRVWNVDSGLELFCASRHDSHVTCLSFAPDGRRVASGSSDRTLRVWEARTGVEQLCLRGYDASVTCAAFAPEGRHIAGGSVGGMIRVWDAETGAERLSLFGYDAPVSCLAFSPDGQRLASGSTSGKVQAWNLATGARSLGLKGFDEQVSTLEFTPDSRRIVSTSEDGCAGIWDGESGAEIFRLRGYEYDVCDVAFTSDGRIAAAALYGGTVRVWDLVKRTAPIELRGHTSTATNVASLPDGSRIVSGSYDGTVRVWDLATGANLLCLGAQGKEILSVAFSPDGRLVAGGSDDGTVRLWDAQTGIERHHLAESGNRMAKLEFASDGRRIIGWSNDGTIRVWDTETGAALLSLLGHESTVTCVTFSPDGSRIVGGTDYGMVRVWDTETGAERLRLKGHKRPITVVVFAPDGRSLASGSDDTTLRTWDMESGALRFCLQGHKSFVESLAFAPNGRLVVSGSNDKTVRVWDAVAGIELLCLRRLEASVISLSFSPDSRQIAGGTVEGTVRIWSVDDGSELLCLQGHEAPVTEVAYSPDGRGIVSASHKRSVRIWDAATGECLASVFDKDGVMAFARGIYDYQCRVTQDHETLIEPAGGGQALASFPAPLLNLSLHISGRLWAGSEDNYLCLIRLEGNPGSTKTTTRSAKGHET